MANQSAKYRKRGGSGIDGVQSAFTKGASLVGGKRRARGKGGRTKRKSRRGGFGRALLPLALVAAQQYASKRRGNVLPVRLAKSIVRGTRRGLGAVRRSVGKTTRRVTKPFTRKARNTRRRR